MFICAHSGTQAGYELQAENAKIVENKNEVKIFLEKADIFYKSANEIFLNGELASSKIRKKEITSSVSLVSALVEVRKFLVNFQRKIGKEISKKNFCGLSYLPK